MRSISAEKDLSEVQLVESIYETSRKQYRDIVHGLEEEDWDYFQFIDTGLDMVQHYFWQYFDKRLSHFTPDNPYQNIIPDYYHYLDGEIGKILENLSEDTAVAIISPYGIQGVEENFFINEWLVRKGYLVLQDYPKEVTHFDQLKINWRKTRAWSIGGEFPGIYLNIIGRETSGIIRQDEIMITRSEMIKELEALHGSKERSMGLAILKPEDIYLSINQVAPDLIVDFGNNPWRSVSDVGLSTIHGEINVPQANGWKSTQSGLFILAGANNQLLGEIPSANILDITPTLLEMAGLPVPDTMQGRSLMSGIGLTSPAPLSESEEDILRERLSGLGYIS
jgi:predicted AlkP superfamily phosphohydrolase/phosphomutase